MPGPGKHLGKRRKHAAAQRRGEIPLDQPFRPPAPRRRSRPSGVSSGSSLNSITGGEGVRRVERQTSPEHERRVSYGVQTDKLRDFLQEFGEQEIIDEHIETDDQGRPKMEEQEIPVLKTSEKEIEEDQQRLRKSLREAAKQGASDEDLKKLKQIGRQAIAIRNYEFGKGGKVRTRTVKVPKIKTSPEELSRAVGSLNERLRLVKTNKQFRRGVKEIRKEYFEEKRKPDNDFISNVARVIGMTAEPASSPLVSSSGYNLEQRVTRPGFLRVMEYLSRPGRAVEAQLGKGLVKAGLIKGKTAEYIKKAPGPIDALLHGEKEDTIRGGHLTEGLFGVEQAGLAADILTDPLMYIGVGGLITKPAVQSAAMAGRLAKVAPQTLKSPRLIRLAREAKQTGNFDELLRNLKVTAGEQGVSTRMLGRLGRDRKALRSALNEPHLTKSILGKAKEKLAKAPKLSSGQKVHVPGQESLDAVTEAAKHGLRRGVGPGARIRIMTPLGHEFASVPLKLPKSLARARVLPVTSRNRAALALSRQREAEAKVYQQYFPESKRLRQELAAARRAGDRDKMLDLRKQLDEFGEKVRAQAIREGNDAAQTIGLQSPLEISNRVSRQRYVHELSRGASILQHNTARKFMGLVDQAVRPLRKRPMSLRKVQLHRMMRADRGAAKDLERVAPLDDVEQRVMDDLDLIDKELGRYGQEVGTLNNLIEDYTTRIYQRSGDPFGLPRKEEQTLHSYGTNRGASPFSARHRQQFEMASISDPEMLATQIQHVARNLTQKEAREIAERWFQTGKIRMTAENLARAVQRGREIHAGDLQPIEQQAYQWSRRLSSKDANETPLFQDLAQTEGYLKLHPDADRTYGIGAEPFESLDAPAAQRARVAGIEADRARIRQAMENLPEDSPLAQQYGIIERRLMEEKAELGVPPSQSLPDDKIMDPGARLPDLRAEDKTAVVLDPRASAFWRLNAEGRAAAYRARWQAIDRTVGRDVRDATETQYVVARTGERGNVAELRRAGQTLDEFENDPNTLWHGTFSEEPMAPSRPVHVGTRDAASQRLTFQARRSEFVQGTLDDVKPGSMADEYLKMNPKAAERPLTLEDAEAIPVQIRQDARIYNLELDPDGFRTRYGFTDEGFSSDSFANGPAVNQLREEGYDGVKYINGSEDPGSVSYMVFDPEKSLIRFSDLPQEGFIHRLTDQVYRADELDFPEQTLIPASRDGSVYYDVHTGKEYARPASLDPNVGVLLEEYIGPQRLWPTETLQDIKGELLRQGEEGYQVLYKSGMESLWGRVSGMIRYGVTVPFPAYHIRNMIADVLKSLQADTGVAFHPVLNAKLTAAAFARGGSRIERFVQRRQINVPVWGRMSIEDFLLAAEVTGIRSSQHLEEFARLAETGKFVDAEANLGKRVAHSARRGFGLGPTGATGQRLIELGARREDVVRFMTFTQRLRHNGGDAADAAWYMVKHHFDYGDLTIFERRVMRNLFLFYTWYRKNIPLQFLEIISRPGFFSAVGNSYVALAHGETPLNVDWSKLHPILPNMSGEIAQAGLVPDYMLAQLGAFTTSWNGHTAAFAFGAPWVDINLVNEFLANPVKGGLQASAFMNPAVTTAAQLIFKKDILTGRDLKQRETSGMAELINGLSGMLGLGELPKDDRDKPLLPWALGIVLRNIPIAGRASTSLYGVPTTRDPGRLQTYGRDFSWLTGVNVMVTPKKGKRLDQAYLALVVARAAQRDELSERLSNEKDPERDKILREFDDETLKWAKERGIKRKYLRAVQGIGRFYLSEDEKGKLKNTDSSSAFGTGSEPFSSGSKGAISWEGINLTPDTGVSVSASEDEGAIAKSLYKLRRQQGKAEPAGRIETPINRLRLAGAKPGAAHPKDHPNEDFVPDDDPKLNKIVDPRAKKLASKFGLKPAQAAAITRAAQKHDVPPEILASLSEIESHHGTLEGSKRGGSSSAGALGPFQFLPSSWETTWGAKASKKDIYNYAHAAEAAAIYLRNAGWKTGEPQAMHDAIFSYNHAEWYVQDVLEGAEKYRGVGGKGLWKGPKGKFTFASQVTGELRNITPEVKKLGQRIAGLSGVPVSVISANRPGATTTTGNPSDHASGNALDIDAHSIADGGSQADQLKGDKIAASALIAAGMKPRDAKKAVNFGRHEPVVVDYTGPNGIRVQVIWKTPDYGGHENHVHVGIRGGSTPGTFSSSGGSAGYGVAAGGSSGGGTGGGSDPFFPDPLTKLASKEIGASYDDTRSEFGLPNLEGLDDGPDIIDASYQLPEADLELDEPYLQLIDDRVRRPRYRLSRAAK